MLVYLIQGIGYGFAAAAQPGPFQTFLISQSLQHGWRRTLPAALAPLLTDGPIILLVLLLLSQVPDWFQRCLHLAGGLFMLVLARSAFLGWQRFNPAGATNPPPGGGSLFRAATVNLLNPGPYLYWSLVTGPILLAGWLATSANGIGFLAGFYLAMLATLGIIILVFATARHLGPRVNRALLGLSALALAGFGVYQIWLAVGAKF